MDVDRRLAALPVRVVPVVWAGVVRPVLQYMEGGGGRWKRIRKLKLRYGSGRCGLVWYDPYCITREVAKGGGNKTRKVKMRHESARGEIRLGMERCGPAWCAPYCNTREVAEGGGKGGGR